MAGVPSIGNEPTVAGNVQVEAFGPFTEEQVRIDWQPASRRNMDDAEIEAHIAATWETAVGENPRLFPGPLCRLESLAVESGCLVLRMSRTDYRELWGTNLTTLAWIARQHPQELDRYLSNGTGLCCAVVTRDHFLLVQHRSRWVSHAGFYHIPGGHLDPTEPQHLRDGVPSPFLAMQEELLEELGLDRSTYAGPMSCLGVVRSLETHKPEIVMQVALDLDATSVERAATCSTGAAEHDRLLVLPDTPEELSGFIQARDAQLVPVGKGGLLLYGRRRFGEEWFGQRMRSR